MGWNSLFISAAPLLMLLTTTRSGIKGAASSVKLREPKATCCCCCCCCGNNVLRRPISLSNISCRSAILVRKNWWINCFKKMIDKLQYIPDDCSSLFIKIMMFSKETMHLVYNKNIFYRFLTYLQVHDKNHFQNITYITSISSFIHQTQRSETWLLPQFLSTEDTFWMSSKKLGGQ